MSARFSYQPVILLILCLSSILYSCSDDTETVTEPAPTSDAETQADSNGTSTIDSGRDGTSMQDMQGGGGRDTSSDGSKIDMGQDRDGAGMTDASDGGGMQPEGLGCLSSPGMRSPRLLASSLDPAMQGALDGDRIYYKTNPSPPVFPDVERAMWSVSLEGGPSERLVQIQQRGSLHDVSLRDDTIYFRFNDSDNDRIGRLPTQGDEVNWIPGIDGNITSISLGRQHLYYVIGYNPARLERMNLGDEQTGTLVTGAEFPDALVEGQDHLYWHGTCQEECDEPGKEGLWETPLAGGQSRLVVEQEDNVHQMFLVGDTLVAHVGPSIIAYNRLSANATVLAEPNPRQNFFVSPGIGVCGGRVYFVVNIPKSQASIQADSTLYESTLDGDRREAMTFSIPGNAPQNFRFDEHGVVFRGSTKIAEFSDEFALYYEPW